MKWEYNREKIIGGTIPYFRLYTISNRWFNILFRVKDWQGDGVVRATLIVAHRAIQLVIPFNNNKRHIDFRWSLLPRK